MWWRKWLGCSCLSVCGCSLLFFISLFSYVSLLRTYKCMPSPILCHQKHPAVRPLPRLLILAHRVYSHPHCSNPIMHCVLKQQCWQASSSPNLLSLPTNTESSLSTALKQIQLLLRVAVKTNTPHYAT